MTRRRGRPSRSLTLAFLAILVLLYLLRTFTGVDLLSPLIGLLEEGTPVPPQVTPLGGAAVGDLPPWIQVYFTDPDPRDRRPHQGGLDARLVADLERAQRSIHLAAFDLDLETVVEALVAARARGVEVAVVTDDENLADEGPARAYERLKAGKVPLVFDRRDAFMHHKFLVVDGAVVWTGSMNFTDNGVYRNNNNLVRILSPELAANYETEFREMFVDRAFGPDSPANTPYPRLILDGVEVETRFLPEDGALERLVELVDGARQEVLVMAFAFTSDELREALIRARRRGVEVQVLLEARNLAGTGGEAEELRRAGIPVAADANPRILHHKVLVIDGRIAVTGSYNFTRSAERSNDENLLVIHSPAVAERFRREFFRLLPAP